MLADLSDVSLSADLIARYDLARPALVAAAAVPAPPARPAALVPKGTYSQHLKDPQLAAILNFAPTMAIAGITTFVAPQVTPVACLAAGAGDFYAGEWGRGLLAPLLSVMGYFGGALAGYAVGMIASGFSTNVPALYGQLGTMAGIGYAQFVAAKSAYRYVEYNNASALAMAEAYENAALDW